MAYSARADNRPTGLSSKLLPFLLLCNEAEVLGKRGHQTICSKSYAKLIGDRGLTFHKRAFVHGSTSDGEFWEFLFQNPLSELTPKGNGDLKGRLACDFEQILR
jgi:hypothetical protein